MAEFDPLVAPGLGQVQIDPTTIDAATEQMIKEKLGATTAPRPDARTDVRATPTAVTSSNDQFQFRQLPDGTFGRFKASDNEDAINAKIKSMYPDAYPSGMQHAWQQVKNGPESIHNAVVDTLRGAGHEKTASIVDLLAPKTWTDALTTASMFVPGYGQMGLAAKLGIPTAAGAIGGTVGGEGPLAGGLQGLTGGLLGKAGEAAGKVATGVGREVYTITSDLLKKFNEKLSPGIGRALMDSIPSLQTAGVKVKDAMDIRNLMSPEVRSKVGRLFNPVEDQIAKVIPGTIEMPVEASVRQASSSSAGRTASKATRTAETTGQTSDVTATTELLTPGKANPRVTRVQTDQTGPISSTTASTGTAETTAQRTAASRSTGRKTMDTEFMSAPDAIKYMRSLRDRNDPMYHRATEAVQNAIAAVDNPLADTFANLRTDYAKVMRLQETLGKENVINKVFPQVGGKGAGLNPAALSDIIHGNPKTFGTPDGGFKPLWDYLGGGVPNGALPASGTKRALAGHLYFPGFPLSFTSRMAEGGANTVPVTSLTPALAKAMETHPVLGKILKKMGIDRAVGGEAATAIGHVAGLPDLRE